MAGLTDGEYLPFTPSLTASLPLAPEYLGWSNLPSSIEKCRCPWPFCGVLPTAAGSSVKPVSSTLTLAGPGTVAPSLGDTKLTLAPGAPAARDEADELELELDSELEPELDPQPAASSAADDRPATRTVGFRCIRRLLRIDLSHVRLERP